MSAKRIEAAKVGGHIYIDLPGGSYIMVATTKQGVEIDVFDENDESVSSCKYVENKTNTNKTRPRG